jgi:hypothetical protein
VTAVQDAPAETWQERKARARQAYVDSADLGLVLEGMTAEDHPRTRVELDGVDLNIVVGVEYTVRIDGLIEAPTTDENNDFWEDFKGILETALDDVLAGRDEEHEAPVITGPPCAGAVDLLWKLVPEAFRAALIEHSTVACTQWVTRAGEAWWPP